MDLWYKCWHSEWRNAIATILCFGIVLTEVELITLLKRRNIVSVVASRKLTHMFTGILFMLAWTLFDDGFNARIYAVIVPLAVTLKFVATGVGLLKDPDTVNMLSRTGQSQELLKGPAAYGFLISLATILWWRSEGAVFTIVPLCMGDGASGLFGHLYGRMRLPWNREKTWLGTFSFFIFAVVSSVLMHFFFSWNGWVPVPYQKYADAMPYYASIASVVVTAMMVESLPLRDWDNLTVFITCAMLYQLI